MQASENGNNISFYRNSKIITACKEMNSYDRKIDDAVDLMLTDPGLFDLKLNVGQYRGLLGEYCFLVRLKWLKDEKKWTGISFYTEEKTTENKHFYPTGLGKRIQIDDLTGKEEGTECDCIFKFDKLDKYMILNETKSGINSFSNKDVKERANIIYREFGMKPGCIAAVPQDHGKASEGSIEYFESLGGNVIVFSEPSDFLTEMAKDLVKKVNKLRKAS
jgi:hypothetical protein